MRYYTTQILSANQELTPEGFLLCKSVPIARTGLMLYAPGEVPVEARDGLVRIERDPAEVFAASTMASFEGKAVTLDHPVVDVDPSNWSALARGITQNVRRGTGLDADLLLADLLITEAAAIQQVRDGLREVSCGYDASYEQIEPGRGRQTEIIGNHVALVEKGRCGARCAIGDSAMKKNKWMDRLRAAFKNRDEAEMEKALNESATADVAEETEEEKKKREADDSKKTGDSLTKMADSLAALTSRVAALETRDAKGAEEESESDDKDDEAEGKVMDSAEENPDEEEKKKAADKKARDSAALLTESQDVFARAEVLAPGIQLPTHDAAADPQKTRDSLCALRRRALETAFAGKGRDAITPFVGPNPDFAKLTGDALNGAFIGASEIVRRENNAQAKVTFDGAKSAAGIASAITSINAANRAFWTRQ